MFVNEMHQGAIRALLNYDPTLFDNMTLPEGVDKQLVVDRILFKYGKTPLFSPDPTVMKYYIEQWSKRKAPLWTRFKTAIDTKYDPLWNYDRTETHEETIEHGLNITTSDDTKYDTTTSTSDDLKHGLKMENKISADNASTYQPDTMSENSGTDERDIIEEHKGTDERDITEAHSGQDTTTRSIRAFGNIGVTTSQQMLQSELDLIPSLDIIEFIADDFRSEFCLDLYY